MHISSNITIIYNLNFRGRKFSWILRVGTWLQKISPAKFQLCEQLQGMAGSLTTKLLSVNIYFEQNLAKMRNTYPSMIKGYTVILSQLSTPLRSFCPITSTTKQILHKCSEYYVVLGMGMIITCSGSFHLKHAL